LFLSTRVAQVNTVPAAVLKLVAAHGLFQELSPRDKALLWRHRDHLLRDPGHGLSLLALSVDWADREAALEMYADVGGGGRMDGG
jgi:hypothetical protein